MLPTYGQDVINRRMQTQPQFGPDATQQPNQFSVPMQDPQSQMGPPQFYQTPATQPQDQQGRYADQYNPNTGTAIYNPYQPVNPYRAEIEAFSKAAATGDYNTFNFADGLHSVNVTDAVYRSAQSGLRVKVGV